MTWLYGYLAIGLLLGLAICFAGTRAATSLAIFMSLLAVVLLWPLFLVIVCKELRRHG